LALWKAVIPIMKIYLNILKKEDSAKNSKAFSLTEMLVVMAIITVICTLLFPVVIKGIDRGKQSQCISNLRQIGQAVVIYTQDWGGDLPQAKRFTDVRDPDSIVFALSNYIDNPQVYICPSADKRFRDWYGISYVYNIEGYQSDSIEGIGSPVRHIASADKSNPSVIWILACARPTGEQHAHFENFSDVLWLDAHVSAVKQDF